jgi:multidrug efflux pump subunit AcrA (membrane-fusion protein)
MDTGTIHGETLAVPERVIVAPAPGTFRPVDDAQVVVEGDVLPDQLIGYVEVKGHSTPVHSPFGGRLMGLLAHAGERVREGQPVAWLRLAH